MDRKDLKTLSNDALKQVYADVYALTQSQLNAGTNVNFNDISYLYSIENEVRLRGMVVKNASVQSKKSIKNTTREERTMRRIDNTLHDLDKKKANRKKFAKYISIGAFLFLSGLILTLTNEQNYIYHGAILTGIGFLAIGVYGLSTEN